MLSGYLSLQSQQLAAESGNASARYLGEPIVIGISDDFEQPLDTAPPHRCDDPNSASPDYARR